MRTTKKVTVSAMVIALSVVFLAVGAMWGLLDLSLAAVSSLLVAFVYIELGSPYTWLVWLSTSLIMFIMPNGITVGCEYFFVFGIYPILKAYIERLPRIFWWIVKLVYINILFVLLIFFAELLFGEALFVKDVLWINVGLYLVMNIAFIAYDLFITVLVRVYMTHYRQKFRKFLK